MAIKPALILLAFFSGATYGQASYYKCIDDRGRPVFSQRPCGPGAEQATIAGPAKSGAVARDSDTWSEVSASNAIRSAEREIERREDRVDALGAERDRKIVALKARSGRANNNLAGAQYIDSLATEMQAVTQQYQAKIAEEQRRIDRLREQVFRTEDATR